MIETEEIEDVILETGDPKDPKPKFDPKKKFEAVKETSVKKPKFNPNAEFEEVKVEKSQLAFTQPEFFKVKETVAKPEKQGTTFFEDVQTQYSVPSSTALLPEAKRYSELETKAKDAYKKINETIGASDDVKSKMIKQRRFENYAAEIDPSRSDMPRTRSGIDIERFAPQEVKPHELPVTQGDLFEEDLDIQLDDNKARRLIKEVGRVKPEKKQELEKDLYTIDAFNSLGEDDRANQRTPKILKNAADIEKGKLEYDVRSQRLYKPEGFIASTVTGWKNKTNLFEFYDYANSTSKEEVIARMEKMRTDYDPDEPLPVPKNKFSEVTEMLGGMPVLPMVAGGTMSLLGFPEAAPFAAGAAGGVDMYKLGWAAEFQREYDVFRQQGLSEDEAYDKAKDLADKTAIADAAMGATMGFIGGGYAGPAKLNITPTLRAAGATLLKKSGATLKRATLEGLAGGGVGAAGQVTKNWLAQEAGIDRPLDEGVWEQIEGNLFMTLGIAAASKLGRGLSPKTYRPFLNFLNKSGKENVDAVINEQVATGQLTEQQANNARAEIEQFGEVDKQIPKGVAEEARFEIQDKLKKREELEGQLDTLGKPFHEGIKEKIKAIDEEILELSKQKDETARPTKESNELNNIIDDAIDEGFIADVMAPIAKSDPKGFLKMIADQVHGQAEGGEVYNLNAEQAAREQYGDIVVDKAIELFPPKIKEDVPAAVIETPIETTAVVGESGNAGEGTPPPVEAETAKVFVERPETELSHRGLQNVANEFSLPDVEKRTAKTDIELRQEATERAQKWVNDGSYLDNVEKLTKKAEDGDVLTDTERVIMEQHLANLVDKARNIADKNSHEYKEVFDQIDRLKAAGQKTRSEAGAALRLPSFRSRPTDTLEDALIAKKEANNEPALTPEQHEKTVEQFDKIDKTRKSFTEKGKELADKIRALRPNTDAAQSQFFGLPIAVYDTALVTIANAVEAGAKLADAIQAGVKYIKDNGGFKDKKEEKNFIAYLKGEPTQADRLAAHKKRIQDSIDKIKKKTFDRDFEKDPKTPLELDAEAQQLKKELRKAKYEFELELQKDKLAKRPMWEKVKDVALEPFRTVRTLLTSFDFSAVLRQGIVSSVAHPDIAAKALPQMFKQAFNKEAFDTWLADLKESPAYNTMENAGLYIADPNNLHLTAREENFMSNLAERVPVVGQLVKGSERAYVSYLNKMRSDLFTRGMDTFMSEGKTPENSPELYEGLASFINNATGRGKLGPLEGSADFLNTVFFSPRLMASRINTLGLSDAFTLGQKGFYSQLPKEVRIMALKDMLKFIGFGTAVLGLAKLGGAEVESDPRSTDFGKIKDGNTRWDIWGGYQQYVRLLSQMATGETKRGGNIEEIKDKDKIGKIGSFFRGKLAPVPSSMVDVFAGENIVGEEATVKSEALESITPMLYRDVQEAMKDRGVSAIFSVGVPAIFGIGTNTYEQKQKANKSEGRNTRSSKKQATRNTRN